MNLHANEGTPDRVIRIAGGILLAVAAALGALTGPALYVAWPLAALLLITGIVGVCPLYAALRLSTCRQCG